jgi:PilZ domain-containing protein
MANSYEHLLSTHDNRPSVRRRDDRFPTRVTALLHCHGRFQTVRIMDFSLGGLQLQGCFGAGVGDDIVVELLSGERIAAKVAWSMGSRLGVRFLQPLSAEHPALAVLRHAADRALHPTARDTENSQRQLIVQKQT